jgi:prepilin-type N-terminal cleavage/methylation domain-containing protein
MICNNKKGKKNFFYQAGFSLVEIMIAVGLLGMISLGVLQLSKQATRVQKGTTQKFETTSIISLITNTLKDPKACENTFGLTSPGGAKVPVGAGQLVSEIKDKSNKTILKANCPSGALDPCIFGKGNEERTLVKSIYIKEYNNPAAPYYNAASQSTLEIELIQGSAIGKWDTMTPEERTYALSQTTGQLKTIKRIVIATTLNTSNEILSCITDKSDFLTGACDQFQGKYFEAERKCKNITVQTQNTNPSITVEGDDYIDGNKLVTNSVNVGATPPGTMATGNLNAEGNLFNKGNLTAEDDLIFLTKAKLSLGASNNNLSLLGITNNDRATLNLGNSGASITGRSNKVGINIASTAVPQSALDVNGDITVTKDTLIKDNLLVGTNGTAGAYVEFSDVRMTRTGPDTLVFDFGNIIVKAPYNDLNTNNGSYVATQGWVTKQFLDKVGDLGVSTIMNEILNDNATDTRVDTVKRNICSSIRNATWISGECVIAANSQCGTHEGVKGFDSNGNLICESLFKSTQSCSGAVPPDYLMTGVISNGIITCERTDFYNSAGATGDMKILEYIGAVISNRINICNNKYPASGGYSGVSYDQASKRCSAQKLGTPNVQYKDGCGPLWDKDDAGSCGCWGGWTYAGYDGCTFNWVVTGGICKCSQPNTQYFSCTISGSSCN